MNPSVPFRLPRGLAGRLPRRPSVSESTLALNLSFVLHERSDSRAVLDTIRRVRAHERCARPVDRPSALTLISDLPEGHSIAAPDLIITASLGLPNLLPAALERVGWGHVAIRPIDGPPTSSVELFRAEADVNLPAGDVSSVAVVALVLRPGGRSAHLRDGGTFRWPEQRNEALRSVEALIQAYADQWFPNRPLWPDPAERLLSGEIR